MNTTIVQYGVLNTLNNEIVFQVNEMRRAKRYVEALNRKHDCFRLIKLTIIETVEFV